MKTYFGVTPAESPSVGSQRYNPGGGIKGAGAEVSGRYQFTPQWAVVGTGSYERMSYRRRRGFSGCRARR